MKYSTPTNIFNTDDAEMVRPERFELPTFWFVARQPKRTKTPINVGFFVSPGVEYFQHNHGDKTLILLNSITPYSTPASYDIRAAIRWRGTLMFSLPVPARHHDLIRKIHVMTGNEVSQANGYEQGFAVDGEWKTREEVFELTGKGRSGKSFSEDLWNSPTDRESSDSASAARKEK